jgi:hypothetical protein
MLKELFEAMKMKAEQEATVVSKSLPIIPEKLFNLLYVR